MPRAQLATLVFAAATMLASCSPKAPADDSKYIETITAARAAKDAALADGPSSPVPPDKRSALLPLPYFPIDPSYAVPAAFEEAPPGQRPQMDMPTSSGQPRRMERIGVLKFNLQGKPLQLGAFVEAGQPADRLFVPFADATTGTDTYRAGRYLDIDRSPTGIYMVDFNTAFNPYCYYNPTYDCPYPPAENRLPLAIRAGEKVSAPK
jgi:uncharacterized protein (DUF1684 family)